jgi:hypothetical protein
MSNKTINDEPVRCVLRILITKDKILPFSNYNVQICSSYKNSHNTSNLVVAHLLANTDLGISAPTSYTKEFLSSQRVPCHQGVARPQVADGDGIQIWRVAANILNKQSRTADRGWSSSLAVGRGANKPPP